jgi:hypothetical protein
MRDEDRSWAISFVNSTKHFINVMQRGGHPICFGEEGKETLRCILASLISAQEKHDVIMDKITTEAEVSKKFETKNNVLQSEDVGLCLTHKSLSGGKAVGMGRLRSL